MESLKTEKITQVAAGGAFGCAHSLALSQAGRTFSWGANEHGQLGYCPHMYCTKNLLGLGDLTNRNIPTVVEALVSKKIVQISCGWLHSACIVEYQTEINSVDPISSFRFIGTHGCFVLNLTVQVISATALLK